MQPHYFDYLANFLKAKSGLIVSADKAYLLESRLAPIASKWRLSSLDCLVEKIQNSGSSQLTTDVIEAMTTNESSFFRDGTPFEHFEKLMLPYLRKARSGQRRISIWSAAASSGQEAYSLAMLLKEHEAEFAGWRIDIFATDLSCEMIRRCRDGVYSEFEVKRGLPTRMMQKYFRSEGNSWRIEENLRKMVTFQQMNLIDQKNPSKYPGIPVFDIIFCRNVMIYFDRQAKADILTKLRCHLADDGFMLLGGSETIFGLSSKFIPSKDHRGLYLPT